VSGREVVTRDIAVPAGQAQLLEVYCPSGKRVVGGGVSALTLSSLLRLDQSFPRDTPFQSGWWAWVSNGASAAVTYTIYAICMAA
jgi:hypothetical protein